MYSTYNNGKSVITERFIETLKAKIYKKMAVNHSKTYLPYPTKVVDQYDNIYHHSIYKKLVNTGYSALNEKIKTI